MHAPEVLYEDNHLIAVRKPAGMPSQADNTGDESIHEWTREYVRVTYNKPGNVYLGLLHRLDRPVSGVMVFARTSKAASRMTRLFKERKVEKTYLAICHGQPSTNEGTLVDHLAKVPGQVNIMRAHSQAGPDRKKAVLDYQLIRKKGRLSLLEVKPQTGRKHQIRVQLARMGCNIVGDVKYGKTDFLKDKSIALYASEIRFVHPVSKEDLRISADRPTEWPWTEFTNS